LGIGGKDGKKGRGLVGWDEKGKDGKERGRKGEKGKGGLDLDICPGAPEFLDSPLYPPHVWAPKIVTYKKSVRLRIGCVRVLHTTVAWTPTIEVE